MAKLQQEARDYGSAWKSLDKAAELRATDARVRAAQEDLAMAWLDDIRGDQGPTPFSATVDMLVPVMSRGVVAAEGSRKADLLAHLGWADFLRWRDGRRELDPSQRYRQALAVDSPARCNRVGSAHTSANFSSRRWPTGAMTRPISTCFESRTT